MHPFRIGLYQLDTTFHKDLLMAGNPHVIDGIDVTFINRDHALNRRVMGYTRYGWIMLLGYSLDYRSLEYIDQVVAPFAKLVAWWCGGPAVEREARDCGHRGASGRLRGEPSCLTLSLLKFWTEL
jgi:hypothetical protein